MASYSFFLFHEVSVIDTKTIIKELNSDKASSGDITSRVLKKYDFSYEVLTKYIKESIFSIFMT